jgi:hypothetical protein
VKAPPLLPGGYRHCASSRLYSKLFDERNRRFHQLLRFEPPRLDSGESYELKNGVGRCYRQRKDRDDLQSVAASDRVATPARFLFSALFVFGVGPYFVKAMGPNSIRITSASESMTVESALCSF